MDFQREVREQLKTYGEQRSKDDEEAERLYLALGRVLVGEKRLPPHDPPLMREDFLGAGSRLESLRFRNLRISAEEVARDEKWHRTTKGAATTNDCRFFQHELLTNEDLVEAIFVVYKYYTSQVSGIEHSMIRRLECAMQDSFDVREAIQAEAISKARRQHIPHASEGSAYGRSDQARRDPARGADPAQPPTLPADWTLSLIEMVANRRPTAEMLQLFRHKFETENQFRQQVVTQDKRYCSSKSLAEYEKAMWLRCALHFNEDFERKDLFENGDDNRRLELLRQLFIERKIDINEDPNMTLSGSPSNRPATTAFASGRAGRGGPQRQTIGASGSGRTIRAAAPSQSAAPESSKKMMRLSMPDPAGGPHSEMVVFYNDWGATFYAPRHQAAAASASASREGPVSSQPPSPRTEAKPTKKSKKR